MDVSGVSSASQMDLRTQVSNEVQKRAQDIQAQSVQQLVNSLPQPQPVPEPGATIGSQVNIFV